MIGITMLRVSSDHELEVYNSIRRMKKVKEVYRIAGECQLLVIMEAERRSTLNRLLDAIRNNPGIIAVVKVLMSKENDPFNEKKFADSGETVKFGLCQHFVLQSCNADEAEDYSPSGE